MNTPKSGTAERTALALDALQHSGFLRVQLRGASMLPTLWPGDEVGIARCSPANVQRGDIVLAFHEGLFFLHRLLDRSEGAGVVTRGDAMPRHDPAFPASAIVGRVAQVVRAGQVIVISSRLPPLHRALGMLLCYSSLARRIALRIHSRRIGRRAIKFTRAIPGSNSHIWGSDPWEIQPETPPETKRQETRQAASLQATAQ